MAKSRYPWDSSGGGGGGSGGGGAGARSLAEQRNVVYDGWNMILEMDIDADHDGTVDQDQDGTVTTVTRKYTWGLDLAGQNGAGVTSAGGPVSDRSFSAVGLRAAGGTLDTTGLRQGQVGKLHAAGGIAGLLAAYDTNGGTSTTSDDRTFLYFYDANGNVGQLVETTGGPGGVNPQPPPAASYGAIAAKYEYDPYGSRINAPASGEYDQPFRFSTNRFDPETGFIDGKRRIYIPRMGRWGNRDTTDERVYPGLYVFVANEPTSQVDPLGLKVLSKTEGVAAIYKGLAMLEKMCDSACVHSCCGSTGCKKEAETLVSLLEAAWNRNYGAGANEVDQVGQRYCWDWANIFDDAYRSRAFNCLSAETGMAKAPPRPDGWIPVHYYLKVYACKRVSNDSRVSFDDGFFDDGAAAAHSGVFPEPNRIPPYVDTNPPEPPPPQECKAFRPTPRPKPRAAPTTSPTS